MLGSKKELTSLRLKLTAQGIAYRWSKLECEERSAIQAPQQEVYFNGAAIAQWIRLRQPSCGSGSNPKHTTYALKKQELYYYMG